MAQNLTDREFARLTGVARQSVAQAKREGRLVAGADGRLDPKQPLNEAYIRLHHTARGSDESAQVSALIAKIELARHAVEHLEASHVERTMLVERWTAAAGQIRERLATLPDRWSMPIAADLGEPEDTVKAALMGFTALLLEETSSFEVAAATAAERL